MESAQPRGFLLQIVQRDHLAMILVLAFASGQCTTQRGIIFVPGPAPLIADRGGEAREGGFRMAALPRPRPGRALLPARVSPALNAFISSS